MKDEEETNEEIEIADISDDAQLREWCHDNLYEVICCVETAFLKGSMEADDEDFGNLLMHAFRTIYHEMEEMEAAMSVGERKAWEDNEFTFNEITTPKERN